MKAIQVEQMTMVAPKGMTVQQWLTTMPKEWKPKVLLGIQECLKRNWPLNSGDILQLTREINSKNL